MVREKVRVRLTPEQRNQLEHMVRAGKSPSRVGQALDVAEGTVFRVKERFAEEGLAGVIQDRPQAKRYRKLDYRGKGHPVSSTGQVLAGSPAPEGHDHWDLRLLADRMVDLGVVESLSHETVRLHLKKRLQAVAEETVAHS